MDFVLLMSFLTAVFILISWRLAHLVVRNQIRVMTIHLSNLLFFIIQGCISMAIPLDLALLGLSMNGMATFVAAYVLLCLKKRKHDPSKTSEKTCLKYNSDINNVKALLSLNRTLYCRWFKDYIWSAILFFIMVLFIRACY